MKSPVRIVSEDFLWHTCGPKHGEPRGFAFIQYDTREEAELAKETMHGRLACGRPLFVRLASEKYMLETAKNSTKASGERHKMHLTGGAMGQISCSAKIAAIKNKLKSLEEESSRTEKQKQNWQYFLRVETVVSSIICKIRGYFSNIKIE